MSSQFAFPGFHENPKEWGQTWSVVGNAPASNGSATELPGINWSKFKSRSDNATRVRESDYHAYIASVDWHSRCLPVLSRAAGFCERCRCPCGELEVHHLTYDRFKRELETDLQALCPQCHARADAEHRAAWAARVEASREKARFDGFLSALYPGYEDRLGAGELSRALERYSEWEERY